MLSSVCPPRWERQGTHSGTRTEVRQQDRPELRSRRHLISIPPGINPAERRNLRGHPPITSLGSTTASTPAGYQDISADDMPALRAKFPDGWQLLSVRREQNHRVVECVRTRRDGRARTHSFPKLTTRPRTTHPGDTVLSTPPHVNTEESAGRGRLPNSGRVKRETPRPDTDPSSAHPTIPHIPATAQPRRQRLTSAPRHRYGGSWAPFGTQTCRRRASRHADMHAGLGVGEAALPHPPQEPLTGVRAPPSSHQNAPATVDAP